ncbi:hypothetical protein FQN53_004435 [Emmonsiellopsis sp. PD_33]|nr:hypothetical protein FQN53_004435 [Emmonsiellopsis sp. PD_33]
MAVPKKSIFLYISSLVLTLIEFAFSEPVQYCRYGHNAQGPSEIDFCMGVTMHYNSSSHSHDMYLTMNVPRISSLGWTAIGLGPSMTGSLMFIIYGDPHSHEGPIVSIRTVDGHHQPKLLSQSQMRGADLRVLQASWMSGAEDILSVGKIAIVCYSCEKWPGTPVSASATSQPWIWAWNDNQDIPVYSYDAHLDMHKHHAGNGGWGNFYVDMARSISTAKYPPSLPPLRVGVARLGTSDSPQSASGVLNLIKSNPIPAIHGFLMVVAFYILFPFGVIAMRSGSPKSYKYHWIIQLIASLFTLCGLILGLVMNHRISTVHQWIGISLGTYLFIQALLGWQHHRVFVRIRRRHWASYLHIWLGRLTLILGWTNIITGMLLSRTSVSWIASMAGLIAVNALFLSIWIWRAARRQARSKAATYRSAPEPAWTQPKNSKQDDYFALGTIDEDEASDYENPKESKNPPQQYDPVPQQPST